jgi:hypothetical protein
MALDNLIVRVAEGPICFQQAVQVVAIKCAEAIIQSLMISMRGNPNLSANLVIFV